MTSRSRCRSYYTVMSITGEKIAQFCRVGEDLDLVSSSNSLQLLFRLLKLPSRR